MSQRKTFDEATADVNRAAAALRDSLFVALEPTVRRLDRFARRIGADKWPALPFPWWAPWVVAGVVLPFVALMAHVVADVLG